LAIARVILGHPRIVTCAAWFGWQAVRPRHLGPDRSGPPGPVPHAISLAMSYMLVTML
jgi:hypothetical protein